MSGPRCVLDASAVLAWLFQEQGEGAVDQVLPHAAISAVNLAEVLNRAAEEGMRVASLQRDLDNLGVEVLPFTTADAVEAHGVRRDALRQGTRLSPADCCCLGAARRLGVPAVGADEAWERLRLGVEVQLLR